MKLEDKFDAALDAIHAVEKYADQLEAKEWATPDGYPPLDIRMVVHDLLVICDNFHNRLAPYTYFLNWMGPVANRWYTDRGLDPLNPEHHHATGRIDVHVPGEPYNKEYGIPPMKSTSWHMLSNWLMGLETDEQLEKDVLLARFKQETGHEIKWWEDE